MDNILKISEENGFIPFECDNGVSSVIFKKDKHVYKINKRNSLERAKSDYKEYLKILQKFPEKLQKSDFFKCEYDGEVCTCIKQEILNGLTLKELGLKDLTDFLKNNPKEIVFLDVLINEFFKRIESMDLYPDLIGNPDNQSLENSINMLLTPERGLVICDVGMSPHEDTLKKHGLGFYASGNVGHYTKKMRESLEFLLKIKNI